MSDYQLPAGYKQTEIGVIPEDWLLTSLEKISAFITKGATPTTYGFSWVQDGVLFLRSECVSENGLDLSQSTFISRKAHNVLNRGEWRSGDILITITGNVGRVVHISDDFGTGNMNQHIARVRVISNEIYSKFVFHFLNQNSIRRSFNSITTGQAYPQISLKQVREVIVPLPLLSEQRSLTQALSDVDALIAALDKLIAKNRDLKTATMQQLLTGKKRLPGFGDGQGYKESVIGLIPEDWEVKQISEIADIDPENLIGNTHAKYEFNYISLEDVERGVLKGHSHQVFCTAPSRARRILRDGDILLSTVRPNLKSHLLFKKQEHNWVCSTGFSVLRCKKGLSIPGLIFSHLFSGNIDGQIETLIAGSNYPAINSSDVQKLKIEVSAVEEQRAIATVLSDMDNAISALESRLAKTQAIKQGMMQELLTGRIRLKIEK